MKKNILISMIVGLIVIAGAFLAVFGSSLKNLVPEEADENIIVTPTETKPVANPASTTVNPAPASTAPAPTPKPSGYTMAQVQGHNSATSCWSAINGNVYDLTNWVNSHPGGKATILMICGKDGSPLFNNQHGRSNKVANILAKYKIGALN